MRVKADIKLTIKKDYRTLNRDFSRKVVDALNGAAIDTDREAKLAAPVDTGRLRDGNRITQFASAGRLSAEVVNNIEYAPFVEFGTLRKSAKPFFFPAADKAARELKEALKKIAG